MAQRRRLERISESQFGQAVLRREVFQNQDAHGPTPFTNAVEGPARGFEQDFRRPRWTKWPRLRPRHD